MSELVRQLGLLRWLCWFRPHEYYKAYFGHCSFDSVNGLSDISYTHRNFCKYCHKEQAHEQELFGELKNGAEND